MLKILVVDDEILVRVGIKALIPWEEYGFKICGEASDGCEALEMCKVLYPDIIFTDIMMPKMDGLELIKKVRKINKNIRCIVLTCLDEVNYVKEAMLIGACGYFAKISLDINQILELMNKLKADIMQEWEKDTGAVGIQRIKCGNYGSSHNKCVSHSCISDSYDCCFLIEIPTNTNIEGREQFYRYLSGFTYDIMTRYSIANKLFYVSENHYILGCVKQDNNELLSYSSMEISNLLKENIANYFNLNAAVTFYDMDIDKTVEMIEKKSKRDQDNDLQYKSNSSGTNIGVLMSGIFEKLAYAVKSTDNVTAINIINYICENENYNISIENLKKNALEVLFIYENILREYSETLDNFFECDFISMIVSCKDIAGIKSMLISFTVKIVDIIINLKENRYRAEIDKIIGYINIHFNEKITLDYVSKLINMNSSYFSRLFKEETGMGLIEYITKIRIEKAKEYLKNKDMMLNEISDFVGFEDANYFGRVFKKITGLTPSKYRAKFY